jgi:cadmium resistance transport/sequestration family protein
MNQILLTALEGGIAFAATNVDDLVVLLLFFAQVNAKFRPYHVVGGTYWGFTAIVVLSLVGFFGGLLIAPVWIGLLGILPIVVGIKKLIEKEEEDDNDELSSLSAPTSSHPVGAVLAKMLHPRSYQVAAVTLANGSDNISIYVPLFAAKNGPELGIILIVFYLLLGGLCYTAYRLTQNPKVAYLLTRYGDALVPFVLIALGGLILWERGTLKLLLNF